jgi:hypothetical protein
MRVIALKPGFYGSKKIREGEEFELVELKGFKADAWGKLTPWTLSVEEQFSSTGMKRVEGAEVVEAIAAPKRGRPFAKVESKNLDVI